MHNGTWSINVTKGKRVNDCLFTFIFICDVFLTLAIGRPTRFNKVKLLILTKLPRDQRIDNNKDEARSMLINVGPAHRP